MMFNKILITVVVPMIEEEFDIYIPVSKTVRVTRELLVKMVNELSDGYFPIRNYNSTEIKTLLLSGDGVILGETNTIKDCGLKNGDKIIMI